MAFISLKSGTRINVDQIVTYVSTEGGDTGCTYITFVNVPFGRVASCDESPEELDALIAAVDEEKIRKFHAIIDQIRAEHEAAQAEKA